MRSTKKWRGIMLLAKVALAVQAALGASGAAAVVTPPAVDAFDAAARIVRDNFHDKAAMGRRWDELAAERRKAVAARPEPQRLQDAFNDLLAELGAAHAVFLTDGDQEYWAMRSMFAGQLAGHRLRHTGAWFERRGARWFVRDVLAGSPAAAAGLQRGDEVLAVDGAGLQPVRSFSGLKPAGKARLRIKRTPWDEPRDVLVGTVLESFQESLLKAMKESRKLYTYDGRIVAYVRLPAATDEAFRKELADAAGEAQAKADALVLDLRGGFGAGDVAYLDAFFATLPKQAALYDKPLVALVDSGTRGGREWLARMIQRHERGRLVGERTGGSFLASKLFDVVPDRYAVHFAVAEAGPATVASELEGRGLTPDVAVEAPLAYAAGVDPQLDRALTLARDAASKKSTRP